MTADRKQIIAVIFLSLVIIASFASFRARDSSDLWAGGGFDLQVQFQLASWGFLSLTAIFLVIRRRVDLDLISRGPCFHFLCFVGIAFMSAWYSLSPELTIFRALQLLVALSLIISFPQKISHIYIAITLYVSLNWIAFLMGFPYLDEQSTEWRLASLFGSPTMIGLTAAVGSAGLLARLQSKRTAKICYVICLGLLVTTIAAGSRAAIVGLVVASIFVMAFSGRILMLLAIAALITFSLFFETVRSDIWIHFKIGGALVKEAQSASGPG